MGTPIDVGEVWIEDPQAIPSAPVRALYAYRLGRWTPSVLDGRMLTRSVGSSVWSEVYPSSLEPGAWCWTVIVTPSPAHRFRPYTDKCCWMLREGRGSTQIAAQIQAEQVVEQILSLLAAVPDRRAVPTAPGASATMPPISRRSTRSPALGTAGGGGE